MEFNVTFEQDAGFRFTFFGKSMLLQSIAVGKTLNPKQRVMLCDAIAEYIGDVCRKRVHKGGKLKEIQINEFSPVGGRAYKLVTPEVEAIVRQGWFRLGSPSYYARLVGDPRVDEWEGYSALCIDFQDQMFSAAAVAGYNCLSFCMTRARDFRRLAELRTKFGGPNGRIIEITDIEKFSGVISNNIKCEKVSIKDVKYSNKKMIYLSSEKYIGVDDVIMTNHHALNHEILMSLNMNFSKIIYDDLIVGSMFVKPTMYAVEQERRVVFEFSKDIESPYYIDVHAPEALKYISFRK